MKQHKHDALIREWLDNGMPQVESKHRLHDTWGKCTEYPLFHEDYEYRIVYPPKPKKHIKMLCWLANGNLLWQDERKTVGREWTHISTEDKVIEVEE